MKDFYGVSDLLLCEDDCAPDARAHFESQLEHMGLPSIASFFASPDRRGDEMMSQYRLDDMVLEISGDDPYYKLYRLANSHKRRTHK
jgi:hypothetical protein